MSILNENEAKKVHLNISRGYTQHPLVYITKNKTKKGKINLWPYIRKPDSFHTYHRHQQEEEKG